MRSALAAAFLGSTMFVSAALAQGQQQVTPNVVPQGEAQGKAAVAECQRLLSLIETTGAAGGVTADQARAWLQQGDAQSCTTAREQLLAGGSANPPPNAPAGGTTPSQPTSTAGSMPTDATPPAQTPVGYLKEVPPGVFSAERLKGVEVIGLDVNRIGEIEDVMVDRTGRVAAVVIGVGGFLGIGQKSVAVPFEALLLNFEAAPTEGASSSNTGTNLQVQSAGSNDPTSPGVNTTGATGARGTPATGSQSAGTGGTAAAGGPGPLTSMAQGSGSDTTGRSGMEAAMGGTQPRGPATVPVVSGELKRVVLRATKAELQNAPEFRSSR